MTEKTNNHVPAVSIGMPVYNGEKYIIEALDSLLNQTFKDFELIISDNSSTDGTSKICKEFANRDSRVKYLRQDTNIGPTANFEFVLQKASGKFFMWAAHDDRWKCTFLEKLVETLVNDQECGLAFSNYIVRNLETGEEGFVRVCPSETNSKAYNYLLRTRYMFPSLVYGLYRKELIENTKVESFDFAEVHFLSELSLKAKVKIVDDYLYIAGTKGERVPYSVTGKRISRGLFLEKQYKLLKSNFSFPISFLLFLGVCLVLTHHKIRFWRY